MNRSAHVELGNFNIFICLLCLQEYVCDAYAKAEFDRLQWFRRSQDTVRADLYKGVVDACSANDTATGRSIGERFILLATFTGSQRYMNSKFQVCVCD